MRYIFKSFEFLVPKSLIARFTLIICIPMIICQFFAVYVFYERHWSNVTFQTSNMLGNQVSLVVDGYNIGDQTNIVKYLRIFNFDAQFVTDNYKTNKQKYISEISILHSILAKSIRGYEYTILNEAKTKINIFVKLDDGRIVQLALPSKPLLNPTSDIFVFWIIGISILFLVIALLFAKNQIKFIEELSDVANNFGKGGSLARRDFKPKGANEIRQAGVALIKMQERIEKQVQKRLQMLAMISHDLRTPLTRMLLQLELTDESTENSLLKQDAESMKHMIDSYLDFARGEEGEKEKVIEISSWIANFFEHSKFQTCKLSMPAKKAFVLLKPLSFRRALTNLISNAEKYSTYSEFSLKITPTDISFSLEDNGPGIKEEERTLVFKAFYRSDKARRIDEYGSVGLGLSIAKEIILGNNGVITILDSKKLGGARIIVTMPRYKNGK